MSIKSVNLNVDGMICTSCEKRIKDSLEKVRGITSISLNFKKQKVFIEYDDSKVSLHTIVKTIESQGYTVLTDNSHKSKTKEILWIFGILIVALAIMMLSMDSGSFNMESKLSSSTSYIMLFVIGIFTSIHCVGMCGGILMSQSIITLYKPSIYGSLKPIILYNMGRVISYTILGGIVGALGSVLSISLSTQALISIFAGLFMVIMGFNLSGFSLFRAFSIKLPLKKSLKNKSSTPFIVGLLNGFMPCGPLQTMQLYALASGSFTIGALSMMFFALGTIPLMLTFGLIVNFINSKNTKYLIKISGLLVILLGFIMANRGLTLLGIDISPKVLLNLSSNNSKIKITKENKAVIKDGKQIIKLKADSSGYSPNVVFIQKNMKTELVIESDEITSCNNEIVISSLNIRQKLKEGENIISFISKDDDINYSCWMGMLKGYIKVVDDINNIKSSDIDRAKDFAPESSSGSMSSHNQIERSIYGINLSEIPTERLIKKVNKKGNIQNFTIKSIGNDLDPLVLVVEKNIDTYISFDFSTMNSTNGNYYIYNDTDSPKKIKIPLKDSKGELSRNFNKSGPYIITNDEFILGVIEVVDDISKVNLNNLRKKYIN